MANLKAYSQKNNFTESALIELAPTKESTRFE
jgi:hypothetical protein